MNPEEILRRDMRWREDVARRILEIEKRLDYIEPREARCGAFAYGEIWVEGGGVAQTIPTGAGYTKVTMFTDDGYSLNCTNDVANDKITITETGIYLVHGAFSFSSGTANVNVIGAAFLNGVEQSHVHFQRKIGTANDVGAAGMVGLIDVTTVPWDLDLRLRHDSGGGVNITLVYGNLNCIYLGIT